MTKAKENDETSLSCIWGWGFIWGGRPGYIPRVELMQRYENAQLETNTLKRPLTEWTRG